MRLPSLRAPVATALLAGWAAACSGESQGPVDGCTQLFGRPNAATGLGSDRCQPSCACGGATFSPPVYDAAFTAALVSGWVPSTPTAPLTTDPYLAPAPPEDPWETVCAVIPEASSATAPRPYRLQTFPSEVAARAAGGSVTHFGRCGVCSSLENLAVYVAREDLTAPVRTCGTQNLGNLDGDVQCLMALGFDLPCAQIWAYNTRNTASLCAATCFPLLTAPYNTPDGGLNDCLQCDEDRSGAVFKAVAGRTRRNSGLPNAICRPCSEVRPLVHAY